VTAFLAGTRKLYDFVNDNPGVQVMDITYVNDTSIIRQNTKVTAINSAIEIDLTGQVCSDSIGTYQYSGIGGQMDFIHGASLSEDGKPIIALPSQTRKGISRIVPCLKDGAGVVTTRGHVHWVVTEYGIVNLFGKSLKQRAKALIQIAHPGHRDMLEKAYYARFKSNVFSLNPERMPPAVIPIG
jgi:acyl-CoA hydrolase